MAAEKKDADKLSVTFGGFIDTYYAFDFNSPGHIDRNYGSPGSLRSRHPGIMSLMSILHSSKQSSRRIAFAVAWPCRPEHRFRPSTATEYTIGTISGPSLSRNIQEAVIGYRLAEDMWVDAGIYLSHLWFREPHLPGQLELQPLPYGGLFPLLRGWGEI